MGREIKLRDGGGVKEAPVRREGRRRGKVIRGKGKRGERTSEDAKLGWKKLYGGTKKGGEGKEKGTWRKGDVYAG